VPHVSGGVEVYQREPDVFIESPLKELRRFDEDQFESRKDMRLHEMTAMSRAVGFTHDGVRVNFWNIIFDGYIAGE